MTNEKEIFTTDEAAQMMGCAPSTIEEHARNRVLPACAWGMNGGSPVKPS